MSKKVTVLKKLVKGNKSNLSLNFYPPVFNRKTGKKTRYEKTSYFIYNEFQSETVYYTDANGKKQSKIEILTDKKGNPKKLTLTPAQKHHNKETNEMIELYRAKRFKEVISPDIYTEAELKTLELTENRSKIFTEYFKKKAQNATNSEGAWSSCYGHFVKFYGNVLFQDINKTLIEDFKSRLLNAYRLKSTTHKISRNSAASYFIRFIQVLEIAYEENYLSENFKGKIDWIEEEEVMKNFLTLDECRTLFGTEFPDGVLKKYCVFALLTGLRYSDISNLKWEDVVRRHETDFIDFRMKKTSVFQYHPISKEAISIMGDRKNNTDFVFERIAYHSLNDNLRKWLLKAKIEKKVTFHNFRTSYAVAQLEAGADIYLISKMLGHKNVSTTEIYAKIVDKRKISTINNIILGL
ncbi:site-specific integrase [Chryseobacterium sp. B21-037]|uniref:tyrosine-type recombinase/integrase n=1 Tax=Chryseobacterium sp. B21-037 TaxID=2926038 RepID=UPI002359F0F5|nr:site-specific integrase [Chryseobacterium sp. B21-037]MDC8104778.1 site-specific integrase [Chryseobacterium sp. B21-037]